MPSQIPQDRVRTELLARLRAHQPAEDASAPADVIETILIREGHYVGRRFRVDGAHAVWLESEAEIRIWADSGELVEVIRLVGGEMQRVVA